MRKSSPKCVECGSPLHVYHSITKDGQPFTAGRGHKGNGLFCTATCGYQWAVRWAGRIRFWR